MTDAFLTERAPRGSHHIVGCEALRLINDEHAIHYPLPAAPSSCLVIF